MESDENSGRGASRAVRIDHRQVRVLAHPLRLRLLGALRVQGPATATTLAGLLATNTGATSYHLRQLADVGLVVEDPDRGTGRQRWWRAAHEVTDWEPSDFDDDPDARAAIEWIQGDQVRLLAERAARWFAVQQDWSPAWRDAFGMSDAFLTLPADRLQALSDELWQVLERYRAEADPAQPDAERVHVFLAAFPMIEQRP
ncbi:helix-turn-helix domain-containing protein [Micromonospora rifamycinica]|uniref:Transcriptional regulator, ArsR family n=1 Tax=Micromonospora rifamycinica TaxID=291594 RepID=A0A109IKL1_9ACTN|nr:helix-turn-helix domain-containing protein [Micromonospora rifamycinica]KWV32265.1 ArsR family transcriptional regulator [Micromonospora rifamycinica]SCG81420.1 transcriptional regulator, ArsR family [Micromonospora rifamycinica]